MRVHEGKTTCGGVAGRQRAERRSERCTPHPHPPGPEIKESPCCGTLSLPSAAGLVHRPTAISVEEPDSLLKPKEDQINVVKEIYKTFTNEQISQKIGDLLKPKDLKAELQIIYQSIEDMKQAVREFRWFISMHTDCKMVTAQRSLTI